MTRDQSPILWTEELKKYYESREGFLDYLLGRTKLVQAVDGIDLKLYPGETLGIVGESGCGKTTLGRALLRLTEPTDGSVYYRPDAHQDPIELTAVGDRKLRDLRTDLQYIFQDPFASLNPRLTVGDIIREPLEIHDIGSPEDRTTRVHELLDTVGLNPSHAYRYPHEFSGGQRQRIGIARALAVDPEVIICDEPVSALDVSVQAQILNLLTDLQAEFDLSYIFIAHDLSVVEHISDRIAVMYLGEIVETGKTSEVFDTPSHPYTEALLSAIPEPDPHWEGDKVLLEGAVPSPEDPPSGCRFHTRCPKVIPPTDIAIEQSTWRKLLDLKLRLREVETVRNLISPGAGQDQQGIQLDPSTPLVGDTVEFSTPPGTDEDTAGAWTIEGHGTDDGDSVTRTFTTAGTYRVTLDLPAESYQQTVPVLSADQAIRREFDLPDELADRAAEQQLGEVISELQADNIDAALSAFDPMFVSPCEQETPRQIDQSDSHWIHCLLYEEEELTARQEAPTQSN